MCPKKVCGQTRPLGKGREGWLVFLVFSHDGDWGILGLGLFYQRRVMKAHSSSPWSVTHTVKSLDSKMTRNKNICSRDHKDFHPSLSYLVQTAITNYHRLGDLTNIYIINYILNIYILQFLGLGASKSRCWQIKVLEKGSFLTYRWQPSHFFLTWWMAERSN